MSNSLRSWPTRDTCSPTSPASARPAAVWFAGRPASDERTYGYLRLEILAAVVNAVLLFLIAFLVLVEAFRG